MEVSSVSSPSDFGSLRTNSSDIVNKNEFLLLLTAQLQHQDPLSPMESTDFIAQLAQFSSLEQLTSINKTNSDMFEYQQLIGGSSMIGMTANYLDPNTGEFTEGRIEGIEIGGETISVIINGEAVPMTNIVELHESSV